MEYLKALDLKLFHFLNAGFVNKFFDFLAPLPEKGLWIAVMLASLALIFSRNARRRPAGFVLLAGYLLGFYGLESLKGFFHRLRPCVALPDARVLFMETGLSFPSGHTCGAFMAAVYLTAVFGKKSGIWLFTAAALVGLSRIYCGVHYPADVIAGAVLGSAFGYLLVLAEKRIQLLFSAARKNAKA
ncbi:MAG: phosphatase PAP2 family protein [Elusimicrobia bacterium]|nr:phosphatase PAP2 family protein [Elusimicrobiota bacterium]